METETRDSIRQRYGDITERAGVFDDMAVEYLRVHLVLVHELLQDPLSVLWIFLLGFRDHRQGSRGLPT